MDSDSDDLTARVIACIRDRLGPADPARSALTSAVAAARHGDPEFAIDYVCQALRYFHVALEPDEFQALGSVAERFSIADSLEELPVTDHRDGLADS